MTLTSRGVGTALAGAALIAAGFGLGYPELVVLGVTALAAVGAALGHATWQPRLRVGRRVEPDRVGRGEACTQELTVHNDSGWQAATLIAHDACGGTLLPVPLIRLRPGQDTSVTYQVPTQRRGVVRLGPLRVLRRDPLGLAGVARGHGGTARVWVHPRAHPLTAVPAGIARSLDGRIDRVPHGSITFDTLREYVLGDELRRVHWRTSARVGELMVREHLDTSLPRIVVLVDDRAAAYPDRRPVTASQAKPGDGTEAGVESDTFEEVCEAAASVVVAAVREDLSVRLMLVAGGSAVGTGEHRAAGPADTRPLLDLLAEAVLREPDGYEMGGVSRPVGAVHGDPGAADGSPERVPLVVLARRLRQNRPGDTLVYLTGAGRAEDLAIIGALHSGYATIVAGVLGDPDRPPPTVEGVRQLAVAGAVQFASAWDGISAW